MPSENLKKSFHQINQKLDWLITKLFAGERKNERSQRHKKVSRWRPHFASIAMGRLQTLFAALVSFGCIVGFVYAVYFYSNTMTAIDHHPLVTNLTTKGMKAHLNFGLVDSCSEPGCWAKVGFDDSAWTLASLPKDALHTMPGYEHGVMQGRIFYRFIVPVSSQQLDSGLEMAFTPVFVSHDRYKIYVNGRLVQTGSSENSASAMVVVSIPRDDIVGGFTTIGIEASLDKTDKGIQHPNALYFGPKTVIEEVFVFKERALGTYFLLFLTTKGAIFVVFSLFFFFSIDRRALFNFLLYAFCVTAENLFAGNFLANYIDIAPRVASFFILKVVSISCLLSFFIEFFQAARARRAARLWNLVTVIIVLVMVLDFGYLSRRITGMHLYIVTNVILALTLFFGISIGLLAIRMWSRVEVEARKIASLRAFVAVICVYFALIVWEFLLNHFVGFDKRAVFDLMFFVFIAFITAKEFGFNAGQVVTLEAHMQEKRRMEAELQEAAEIARAFLPGQLPSWDFCSLGVFHRALSESSGDWYTFEESKTGRFCHFILCDITGHGVQAALVVSTCRTVLSAIKLDNPACTDQEDFIVGYARALNHILYSHGGGHHVSTILGLSYDRLEHKLYYVAGGHPNPLIISTPATGPRSIKALTSRYSLLGTQPSIDHQVSCIDLEIGDEVIAFTDGLPLGANLKVLRNFVREGGYDMGVAAKHIYEQIWKEEQEKRGKQPDDDVSVLWLRRVA